MSATIIKIVWSIGHASDGLVVESWQSKRVDTVVDLNLTENKSRERDVFVCSMLVCLLKLHLHAFAHPQQGLRRDHHYQIQPHRHVLYWNHIVKVCLV